MSDKPKVVFENKREMDAAAFSQAAYVLDQARQKLDDKELGEKLSNTISYFGLLFKPMLLRKAMTFQRN